MPVSPPRLPLRSSARARLGGRPDSRLVLSPSGGRFCTAGGTPGGGFCSVRGTPSRRFYSTGGTSGVGFHSTMVTPGGGFFSTGGTPGGGFSCAGTPRRPGATPPVFPQTRGSRLRTQVFFIRHSHQIDLANILLNRGTPVKKFPLGLCRWSSAFACRLGNPRRRWAVLVQLNPRHTLIGRNFRNHVLRFSLFPVPV